MLILRANALSGRSERRGKFLTEITSPTLALRSVSTSVGVVRVGVAAYRGKYSRMHVAKCLRAVGSD